MDEFKKATVVDYTAFDLNCRHIVSHTKQRNKAEKIIKRKARRKMKKMLDKIQQACYNKVSNEGGKENVGN